MIVVDDYKGRYRGMVMGHLTVVPFDLKELHAFAAAIGLKRAWFRGDHYDVCQGARKAAIALGAKAVTARDLVKMTRDLKLAGQWPRLGGFGGPPPDLVYNNRK